MTTILLLSGVGFLLLLTEMFLPGGVLGVIGSLLLLSAVVVGYAEFGPLGGSVLLSVLACCVLAGFCIGMAIFPRTRAGQRMILGKSLEPGDVLARSAAALVGREGVAATPLRPAGKALIDGQRMDVVAEGSFIENDEPVVVIAGEGARIVVRKKA